ncbi:adenosine deaminase [Pendulispora albinea]|uniref:Adenosine deaminase n=1 Tax=Pendulispora albinea TaxID=2741071 RepID=A0ABZ2LR01_9BACT
MMKELRFGFASLPLILACASASCASNPSAENPQPSPDAAARAAAEARVQRRLDALQSDESSLRKLVQQMPKGADLHHHTSGGIAVEKLIEWAAQDGSCVEEPKLIATPGPCTGQQVPIANARTDKALHAKLLASWSMEGHKGDALLDRHNHFFATFEKFDAVLDNHFADGIADILATAGKNHQTYIELMRSLGSWGTGVEAATLVADNDPWTESYLLQKRKQFLDNKVFKDTLDNNANTFKNDIAKARTLLRCDRADADPGCQVDVRFMMEAYRDQSRGFVFGQWVYGFELAQKEPLVVAMNLVSPEEHPNSLKNYDDEMFAISVLRKMNEADASRRPVHVALHAGELIPEVLPQDAAGQRHLNYHVRRAVEVGAAERIGHGTDILGEVAADKSIDLLGKMREKDVLFEICLSSSSLLLGYEGERHPLNTLIEKNVPVALATDDQGLFRTNITDDWMLAVQRNHLNYRTLKKLARASVEHSFLPGKTLWAEPNRHERVVAQCARDKWGDANASKDCKDYLNANERAALQWKLERELEAFEASVTE